VTFHSCIVVVEPYILLPGEHFALNVSDGADTHVRLSAQYFVNLL
jgi:hypothetical protein